MGLGRETRRPLKFIVCQPYVEDDWDAKNVPLKRVVRGERERRCKNCTRFTDSSSLPKLH